MAFLSLANYTGDGSTDIFAVPFPYLNQVDVQVYLDDVLQVVDTDYSWFDSSNVQFNTPPSNGAAIQIKRVTDRSAKTVDYQDNSVIYEADLDLQVDQLFYLVQEADDLAKLSMTLNSSDVFDGQGKRVTNVADPVDPQDLVTKVYIDLNYSAINVVAGIESEVVVVANDQADIGVVATNIAAINTVASDLNEVGGSEIETVANNITNVNTVGNNISSVNTVAGNNANVTTVAGISSNVTTVASNISAVNTVAADLNEPVSEIDTVAANITNVNNVGTNIANVNTVAGIAADVTTVAADGADIGTVAGISGSVQTVAADSTNVGLVAGSIANVDTVATNIADVNTTATNIASVNTVAANIDNINNVAAGGYTSEQARDDVGTALANGVHTRISFTPDDANDRINATVDVSGLATVSQLPTTEDIQDAAAPLLTAGTHSGISFNYVDASNRIDATVDPLLRPNTVAVAGTTIDCSQGDNFTKTISSNTTFTFSNAPSGKGFAFVLRLTLTGAPTITWPVSVDWPGGTAPTLSSGSTNIISFFTDNGGTTWYGNALTSFS